MQVGLGKVIYSGMEILDLVESVLTDFANLPVTKKKKRFLKHCRQLSTTDCMAR
jgi:hypothetical protein